MIPLYELSGIRQVVAGRTVLSLDALTLPEGAVTGLSGPNGSGKTTLLHLLALISRPSRGTLKVWGQPPGRLDRDQRHRITILPQDPLLLARSVADNVAYGLKIRGIRHDLAGRIEEALAMVGLDPSFSPRRHDQLSGGEARRVALAARLVLRPRVLILDEPTSGVDAESVRLIRTALLTARDRWQTSLVIASHDQHWLDLVSDHRLVLYRGRILGSDAGNLLFGPWQVEDDSHVRILLGDGQSLLLPRKAGSRAETALLDPRRLRIDPADLPVRPDRVRGRILALVHRPGRDGLRVELAVGSQQLHAQVSGDLARTLSLWPGSRISLTVPDKAVSWL